MLKPLNFNKKSAGTALVELKEKGSGAIETPDDKYKSFSQGVIISVDANFNQQSEMGFLVDKTVYFEQFKDSAQVEENDKTYAFIKLEDIVGYRDE